MRKRRFVEGKVECSALDRLALDIAVRIRRLIKECDPTSRLARAGIKTHADNIRQLFIKAKIGKDTISEVLEWYCTPSNYLAKYTPKIRRSKDLYDYFGRIKEAKERQEFDQRNEYLFCFNAIEKFEDLCIELTKEDIKYFKSLDYTRFLQTVYWKIVRDYVLYKKGFTCTRCGSRKDINVHHRTYVNHGREHKNLQDLCLLCKKCHAKVHDKVTK